MFGLPIELAGVLIVAASVAVAILLLLATRGLIRGWVANEHNAVVGALFGATGVVYAVVLAFVVLVVWEQWGAADQAVVAEGAALVVVYRASEDLAPPAQQQAKEALRTYTRQTIDTQWTVHGTLGPHTGANTLNPVWAAFRSQTPTAPSQVAAQQEAFARLSDLEYREHMVHLAREGTLPSVFWLVMIAGAIVTVAFSYLLAMDRARVHALTSGALAGMLAGLLFLVFALNFPFTGTVHVSEQPLEHAILMFNSIDRG